MIVTTVRDRLRFGLSCFGPVRKMFSIGHSKYFALARERHQKAWNGQFRLPYPTPANPPGLKGCLGTVRPRIQSFSSGKIPASPCPAKFQLVWLPLTKTECA